MPSPSLPSSSSPSQSHSPSTVLLLRTPVPPKEGTDPYHDVFGSFCLPSFPMSALDSGAVTPVAPFRDLAMSGGPLAATTTPTGTAPPPQPSQPVSRRASGSSADRVRIAANLAGMRLSNVGEGGRNGDLDNKAGGTEPSSGRPRPEELLLERLQQQQLQQQAQAHEAGATQPKRRQASYSNDPASSSSIISDSDIKDTPTSLVLTTHHASVDSKGNDREWCVSSLPVLGSKSVNAEELQRLLAEEEWGGIVATSNRAWDAWRGAVQRCERRFKGPPRTNYPDTPFFLLSSKSAAAFRQPLPNLPEEWVPKANKVYGAPPKRGAPKPPPSKAGASGEEPSAGEALGEYILGWLQRRRDATRPAGDADDVGSSPLLTKPLLLLQGDKSLTALPDFLKANSIPFQPIEVYATSADQTLQANLRRLQIMYESLDADEDGVPTTSAPGKPDWVVFFSPSGVEYSRELLEELGWFPSNDNQHPRLITLGNTTGAHLREKYGFKTALASSPEAPGALVLIAESADPQGIKQALTLAEATGGSRQDETSSAQVEG